MSTATDLILAERRKVLARQFNDVMTTAEMMEQYEAVGFGGGLVVVRRRSDGVLGSLQFDHSPRLYYGFLPHEN